MMRCRLATSARNCADLIVVPDDRHVVLVGVERRRARLDRAAAPPAQGHAADLAPAADVVEQVGHLVPLRHQPAQQRQAPAVDLQPVAQVLDRAARQLALGAVGGGLELAWCPGWPRSVPRARRGPSCRRCRSPRRCRRCSPRCRPAGSTARAWTSAERAMGPYLTDWLRGTVRMYAESASRIGGPDGERGDRTLLLDHRLAPRPASRR